MIINEDGFLEKQYEKLKSFQKEENKNINPVENEPKKDIVSLKEAVEELKDNQLNKKDLDIVDKKEELIKDIDSEHKDDIKLEDVKDEKSSNLENNIKKESKATTIENKEASEYLNWVNSKDNEDSDNSEKEEKKSKDELEDINLYKSKVQEYESLLNDDYVKAIVEFRKNGGVDISEFTKQLGVVDPNSLTIEDFYKQEASSAGLNGEELNEAVNEAIERYKDLPKIEQLKILKSFKDTVKNNVSSKMNSYVQASIENNKKIEQVMNNSYLEMEKFVKDKVGKKHQGFLLIEDKMVKPILELASAISPLKYDKEGSLIGYDIETGVKLAISAKYEKQLEKAKYEHIKFTVQEEMIKQRNRPSENITTNQVVYENPNDIAKITKQMREEAKVRKKSGIFLS